MILFVMVINKMIYLKLKQLYYINLKNYFQNVKKSSQKYIFNKYNKKINKIKNNLKINNNKNKVKKIKNNN